MAAVLSFFMICRAGPLPGQKINLKVDLATGILFAVILVFIVGTLLLALFSPPNTWDALTYHMSRVMHWVQNGSLAPYPTAIPRQVVFNPGFEYFVLHLFLLVGNDAAVNLVQWLAMLGTLTGVSLLAQCLGASRLGQLMAVVAAITIPMGIVEASSLQGDYMAAFFIVTAIYSLWALFSTHQWRWSLLFGASSGLAILVKGIGGVFIAPLLGWFLFDSCLHSSLRRWSQVLGVIVLLVIINFAPVWRLSHAFDSKGLFEISKESREVMNARLSGDVLAGNLLRNAGSHAGTSFESLNGILTKVVKKTAMKVGVNLDDPRDLFNGIQFEFSVPTRNENMTSAGWHLLLVIVFFCCAGRLSCSWGLFKRYMFILVLMALLFCALVRWQPWITRFHLPFFLAASAGIGVMLERVFPRWLRWIVIVILVAAALPYLINAYPRALLGKKSVFFKPREAQYFAMDGSRHQSYARAADLLAASSCRDIGLVIGPDDWEYPLWPMLFVRGVKNFRLEHVQVRGVLGEIQYPLGRFSPCAMVKTNERGIVVEGIDPGYGPKKD